MMKPGLKKIQRRDLIFITFILVNLFCIGGFLFNGIEKSSEPSGGGWRRIDLEALRMRINAGTLVTKEAAWYRPIDNPQKGKNIEER